jgi:PAS domain S-box-containing protein
VPTDTPSLWKQKVLFWSAAALIGLSILLSFISSQRLSALSDRADQSQLLASEVGQLLSYLRDIESGARGYAATRDRRMLSSQGHRIAEFERHAGRLMTLDSTVPALSGQLVPLVNLARERVDLSRNLETSIDAAPAGFDPSTQVTAGEALMERVRRQGAAILSTERGHYERTSRALREQAIFVNLFMALAGGMSLGVIAWLFTTRGREVARRRFAEEELRTLNNELEDRVQARTAEVEHTRELLNTIVENMPDMVFLKEAGGEHRYLLINQAGERLLGMSRTDVVGRIDHELFPREQALLCLEEDREIATSGKERIQPERTIATSQGPRVVESRKVPVVQGEGGQTLVLGIVRDVTEQKRLEGQLRQMQRMDAVGRLTGGVAHDFNNLLAIIYGNAELVREQLEAGTEIASMADEVLDAASRGADLVRRLLAFARMQHLETRAVDLNERLPAITGLLRRTLGENVKVVVRPSPELWPALVDPTQVDDAIVNLGINARDAMPGGGTLTIETANATLDEDYASHHVEVKPGEYVMLAISDTGSGMSGDVIARAFEPFFTTKEEGRGTGLGLSQVYGWVKQSNGHIKIYSELGHGTTLKLYLPRAGEGAASAPATSAAPMERGHEIILVVEDNPKVRQTVLRQLTDLGYSTLEASSGAEALELVRSGARYDMMLTDVVMPGGMTGYELAERVESLRPDLKVLFTSGYTELAVTDGHVFDKRSFLSKPYRKQDLARAIRRVLDESRNDAADTGD